MTLEYIKTEWKKLGSMSLIIIGAFLLLEHIYTYGFITLMDFLGHEWFGIILIVAGLLVANKSWVGDKSPIQYALDKIKYILKGG